MKKHLLSFLILFGIILSFSACGYNEIMIQHLSDINNYTQYDAKIINMYYEYEEGVFSDNLQNERITDVKNVYIDVLLNSKEEIAHFYGVAESSLNKDCSEYSVRLKIIPENCQKLLKTGFFDVVKTGDNVVLKASNWIYQDSEFFYIIAITRGEVEFLNESDGLKNIVRMMQENKSLF